MNDVGLTNRKPPRVSHTVGVVIPTWCAEKHWGDICRSLQWIAPEHVLIMDSSSTDQTRALAAECGYQVVCIPREDFNHGQTRQRATAFLPDSEFLLYMTQDAQLVSAESIQRLCDAFEDTAVGAAYGRQKPRAQADAVERHARLFNYPLVSHVRAFDTRQTLGIRAAFLSNSFAMYRRSALVAVGGFPENVISAEDSYVAAKMLIAGWKLAYQADAVAIHSHGLTVRQEFVRYFDIGVHHDREMWLLDVFGDAGDEGKRFFLSELRYLLGENVTAVPLALLRTASKLLAYRLGRNWSCFPDSVNRKLSSNPPFWDARVAQTLSSPAGTGHECEPRRHTSPFL